MLDFMKKARAPLKDFVLAEILRMLDSKEISPSELADRLGVSRGLISQFRSGRTRPGEDTIDAFVHAFDTSYGKLEEQAAEWAKANPPRDAVVVREARYPRLELAIQFAADSKPASAEAIEYVRSIALKSNDDRSAEEWLQELRFAERLIREKAGPQLPARPMPPPEGRPPLAERLAKAKGRKS